MKKRGQLFGQPFVFIFALIVGALILIFGARYIIQLKDTGEQVQVVKFIERLREDVNQYYFLDVGSSKIIRINLPNKVKGICFKKVLESTSDILGPLERFSSDFSRIITNDPNINVVILPLNIYPNFKVDHLGSQVESSLLWNACFENGKNFKIVSAGDKVNIALIA